MGVKSKIRRNAKLVAVKKIINGKEVIQYYNPVKHLMQNKGYKESQGAEALELMLQRNKAYLDAHEIDVNLEEK